MRFAACLTSHQSSNQSGLCDHLRCASHQPEIARQKLRDYGTAGDHASGILALINRLPRSYCPAVLRLGLTAGQLTLMDGSHHAPENLHLNPKGLVPTLAMDALVLTQPVAIWDYLDEMRRRRFLPTHTAGRARMGGLSKAMAMWIAPVCNLSVRNFGAKACGGAITADDWQLHFMQLGLAAVERMLDHPTTGTCCHGDGVTIADICLVPQI